MLRWVALQEREPEPAVWEAFAWLQGRIWAARATSLFGRSRPLALDMRWAAIETSRRSTTIDGKRLALLNAAIDPVVDWVESNFSIATRMGNQPPRVGGHSSIEDKTDGLSDQDDHLATLICLLRVFAVHRARKQGQLAGPSDRLDALEDWKDRVEAVGALSPYIILAAAQTALAGDGAPARALCKFEKYQDRASALKAANNAAWDMNFLRQIHHSEVGVVPYESIHGPTTLLTFDRQFAESARSLSGVFQGISGRTGSVATGAVAGLKDELQRDVRDDPHMMNRLKAWSRSLQTTQVERAAGARPLPTTDQLQPLLDETLEELFPDP
jgi:hypothetical protein